jgi:hypothetical protein
MKKHQCQGQRRRQADHTEPRVYLGSWEPGKTVLACLGPTIVREQWKHGGVRGRESGSMTKE